MSHFRLLRLQPRWPEPMDAAGATVVVADSCCTNQNAEHDVSTTYSDTGCEPKDLSTVATPCTCTYFGRMWRRDVLILCSQPCGLAQQTRRYSVSPVALGKAFCRKRPAGWRRHMAACVSPFTPLATFDFEPSFEAHRTIAPGLTAVPLSLSPLLLLMRGTSPLCVRACT